MFLLARASPFMARLFVSVAEDCEDDFVGLRVEKPG